MSPWFETNSTFENVCIFLGMCAVLALIKHAILFALKRRRARIARKQKEAEAERTKLAISMIQPLRRNLDYAALGRKLFQVEQLPPGAVPIYDREGWQYTEHGVSPVSSQDDEIVIGPCNPDAVMIEQEVEAEPKSRWERLMLEDED
jgi:hypothetical protein